MKKLFLIASLTPLLFANFQTTKNLVIKKDEGMINIFQNHLKCAKNTVEKAELKECNFKMQKAKKILNTKIEIEKIKIKTGVTSVPKLENKIKCIESAKNNKELKKCK
jgi:hypothetical protein